MRLDLIRMRGSVTVEEDWAAGGGRMLLLPASRRGRWIHSWLLIGNEDTSVDAAYDKDGRSR